MAAADTTPLWLGISTAVAAAGALIWRINTWRLQRPQLAVTWQNDLRTGEGLSGYDFRVVVANLGSEAITVNDAGLRSGDYSPLSIRMLRHDGVEVTGPQVPCRVKGHGTRTWELPGTLIADRLPGPTLAAWATQMTRVRLRPISRRVVLVELVSPVSPNPVATL
jgi:hypothetical protein